VFNLEVFKAGRSWHGDHWCLINLEVPNLNCPANLGRARVISARGWMRSIVASAATVLLSSSAPACNIEPQANLKLEPKDQAALIALGRAIDSQVLLKGLPVAVLFSEPGIVLTLKQSDAKPLSQALVGLRKAAACHADGVMMERILENDTPGIRFLRQIEGCLADACVDNQ
jgi:hypothetical protein